MFSDPQFWVFIAFIIFIGAVFNPVRKILLSSLDQKINAIKNNIDEAEKIKKDTQISLSEVKKRQNKVKEEVELIFKEAEKTINLNEKNSKEKLLELIEKRKLLATMRIDQLTRDANTEIQQYITSTAIKATKKILEKKLDDKEKQNLINQSIKEVNILLKN